MNNPAAKRNPRKNALSLARLESLETRCLLTAKMPAQITIQEVPSTLVSGTTELVITGTKKNDGISISDNGTGTAGNIFVSLERWARFHVVRRRDRNRRDHRHGQRSRNL